MSIGDLIWAADHASEANVRSLLKSVAQDRDALRAQVEGMREAIAKDRTMFITWKEIEDGCFNPDRSKDCACRIRAQLRKEILADIDALTPPAQEEKP